MGAKPEFKSDTVWYEADSWERIEGLDFDPNIEWWLYTKEIAIKACEAGKGKFMVGFPDLGAVTDIAASLRGHKDLVIDFYRSPDRVRKLCDRILEIWLKVYEELYTIARSYGQKGTSTWMKLWCHKRWYPIHADFAYMLSPSKFDELVLPYLEEYCLGLDYTIYHLDGIGQIPHLDRLLDVEELTGIQWVPGAGQPDLESSRWLHLYRKVQKKERNLVLHGVTPEGARFLLNKLKPKGLVLNTHCRSEMEAKQLLEEIGGKKI